MWRCVCAIESLQVGTNVQTIPLSVKKYEEIVCPEALRQGRAGGALGAGAGAAGIAQKCVEVTATASNPTDKEYLDVGVFGLVTETSSAMSTLGNGQDGKNDAGQFAMIDKIPAGDSVVTVRARLLAAASPSIVCAPGDLPIDAHAQHFFPARVHLRLAVPVRQPTEHRLQVDPHREVPYRGQGTSRASILRQDEGHLIPGRRSL